MQDNTAKWGVRKLTKFKENSGLPVGFEYFSTNPNIPAGSIPLFGGEYSREVYSDLWSWVQEQAGYLLEESEWQAKASANDGNVPFYSKGDGSTTFRVPSLKCWVKGANGIEEVGSYLSAGLPNITGSTNSLEYNGIPDSVSPNGKAEGVFSDSRRWSVDGGTSTCALQTINGNTGLIATFSASLSNPIYGNSDTVQPKSIVGMWLVKAYGTVTNVGSTDVAAIAQGLTEVETRTTEVETLADENKAEVLKIKKNLGTIYVVSESVASVYETDIHLCDLTLEEKGLYLLIGNATISSDIRGSYQRLGFYSKSKGYDISTHVRTTLAMGGGLCYAFLYWANAGEVVCISSYGYSDSSYNINGRLSAIKLSD